jgi:starch phosphorylase
VRAVREFNVVPAIPEPLKGLSELASNLHWTWDRDTQQLFRTLDPVLWEECGRDPLRLLVAITADGWARLAADPEIVGAVDSALARLKEAVEAPRWFQARTGTPLEAIAYFSPEFGLSETLPQYSGGLGVLAGDH